MDIKERFNMQLKVIGRAKQLKLFPSKTCPDQCTMAMDITLAKSKDGKPVDIKNLLTFPDGDFIHDVTGINANIHRERDDRMGQMDNCFCPRCGFEK